jgi:transcriptional regulator with XRE-family HTH domain
MFNRQFFAASIETHIAKHKLSLRQAAKESQISASTLSRLLHGALPDMESFEKCVAWLQRDPGVFFTLPQRIAEAGEADTVQQIVTLLRMDLSLPTEARERLVDLVKAAYQCLVKEGDRAAQDEERSQQQ